MTNGMTNGMTSPKRKKATNEDKKGAGRGTTKKGTDHLNTSDTSDNVSNQPANHTNHTNHSNVADIGCNSVTQKKFTNLDDMQAHYEEKFKMLEEKFKMSEVSFLARVDGLHRILEQTDEVIGKLNMQIGELKKSFDFLSKETSDIKISQENATKNLETKIEFNGKYAHEIKAKTIDLEDRSRRENLVFFNFPETAEETTEHCEQYIKELISSLSILPEDEELYIDRAHRLGRKTPECANKPRPIIAKFAYYKQKNEIIRNGFKFRNTAINVSEDYSRETLREHKLLREHGRNAAQVFSDPIKSLVGYKVVYKRLLVTYSTNKNRNDAKKFVKSFTLDYIKNNPYWFKPQVQRLDND